MPRPKGATTRNADAKKTGPRFNLTEREGLKAQVAKLDLHGYTQRAIAEKLGISQPTACLLLKEIRDDYESAYITCRKALVMQAMAAHLDVIRQAQEQVEQLRARGRRKTVTEEGATDRGGFRKTVATKEDGEIAGLLSVITDNWTRIARLHGLEEVPRQVMNLQVNQNANVFERVLQAVLQSPPPFAPGATPLPIAAPAAELSAKGAEDPHPLAPPADPTHG